MKVVVKMCGTCGESAQGFFRAEPLLITCPIEKFSTAIVSDELAGVEGLGLKSRTLLVEMFVPITFLLTAVSLR